jgi:hypothetical protein
MAFSSLVLLALLAQDFTCPMDPDVRSKGPGKCPRCGMTLEARIIEPVEYPTTFRFQAPHLSIEVHDPKTGAVMHDFEIVHEKFLHLFVISSDLKYFAHVHPVDGKIDLALPKAGIYKLGADFYPKGGTPQFAEKFITTPGYVGSLRGSIVVPKPDLAPKGGVSVVLDPPEPIPGKKTLLFLRFDDAEGLETYLGVWAHMLSASNDLIDMVHTHPTIADGGAQMQFDLYFPRAATYKIWVQYQRRGKVYTVDYTIPVKALN